jgi:hypothetical protein
MGFLKLLSTSLAILAVTNAGELLTASDADDVVPSSYIVVMNDGVSNAEFNTHRDWAATVHSRSMSRNGGESGPGKHFDISGMKGYSASFDDRTVKDIASDPAVWRFITHFYSSRARCNLTRSGNTGQVR